MDRRKLTVSASAGMLLFGVAMGLLGAVLPVISARLRIDMADAGNLFLVLNVAMLAASLTTGPLADRFGLKFVLGLGPLLVLGSLAGLDLAASQTDLMISMILLGFGGGALNLGSNTLIADLHEDPKSKNSALNILGIFFGIGAMLIPLQIAALMATLGLARILAGVCALCALISLFTLLLRFPPPKQKEHVRFGEIASLASAPVILVIGILFFFESGNEFTIGGYMSSFLVRDAGASVSAASYLLAGYWAALMVARIFLGRILLRVSGQAVVLACAVFAALGSILMSMTSSILGALPAIALTGIGVAGVFPTVLGLVGARFRERSGTVFGILFTMALTGGITIPWVAGHLADQQGLRVVFQMTASGFCAIVGLQWIAGRMLARR